MTTPLSYGTLSHLCRSVAQESGETLQANYAARDHHGEGERARQPLQVERQPFAVVQPRGTVASRAVPFFHQSGQQRRVRSRSLSSMASRIAAGVIAQ